MRKYINRKADTFVLKVPAFSLFFNILIHISQFKLADKCGQVLCLCG